MTHYNGNTNMDSRIVVICPLHITLSADPCHTSALLSQCMILCFRIMSQQIIPFPHHVPGWTSMMLNWMDTEIYRLDDWLILASILKGG